MNYLTVKALHIIFIVTWFAGLFYTVRLFVYQAEAKERPESERKVLVPQYRIMTKRLWYGITWPSFLLTLVFGPWMIYLNPTWLKTDYMQVKLAFVGGLIAYFWLSHLMFLQLQRGKSRKSGQFFRLWNELATLFLVIIVFIIVLKNTIDWVYGCIGFVLLGALLMVSIKAYQHIRKNNTPKRPVKPQGRQ